jgi:hypothetical protein
LAFVILSQLAATTGLRSAAGGAYPRVSLSLGADIHLNVLNTSYDRMYL